MILTRSFHLLATACWFTTQILGDLTCKTTPLDSNWPSDADWTALNVSINGTLIRSAPYVVNATTEAQIAVAAAWASERNIRLVIKGTGHDLNGRGAYSLSIWTHNFRNIQFNASWPLPGCNKTEDVVIAGSGNIWHDVLLAGAKFGKVVVSGGAYDVGLGGFIQGGGHGPLSSTYGLAADQLLQARVITTNGTILVANSAQNQDLLWALRGGGGGQYGIVIEYILKAYPTPSSVVTGGLSLSAPVK
ncbi:putative 6-hydroxy-D-nicotine oxidase [Glarea lozoyensis 74030]|uniref:Putative 6-hydroxy-D-nicotine oxidase n=1 Tax=Glarea lozoyensis (strain ATCC 74030 / MF5533) TaxID=1104152 RepID=H0EHP6_GLAL7|nr:putative 6-hydroxy-D-nicotine oxidase [Glarea lozoyensis 74030]